MLTLPEFARALTGLRLLIRLDPRGIDLFDNSLEGFWRSFWAAALVAPIYLLIMLLDLAQNDSGIHPVRYLLVQSIGFVAEWAAFPLAMVYVARLIERDSMYFRFMVALNWLRVFQAIVYLPLALASLLLPIPGDAVAFFGLMILSVLLMYEWFLARHALQIEGPTATGVVVIGFLVSLFLDGIANRLLTVVPPPA